MRKLLMSMLINIQLVFGLVAYSQQFTERDSIIGNMMWEDTDIILMNKRYYLIDKSLLGCFEGYKDLYPEIIKSHIDYAFGGGSTDWDMNYFPYWVIDNGLVYLVGISLNHDDMRIHIDENNFRYDYKLPMERFMRMEKLVNKRFEKGLIPDDLYMTLIKPNYSIGAMFASWVNGVYYIKEMKNYNKSISEWTKEPILKLTIENGNIIKTEEI